jgi:hypothetical protein
LNGFHIVDLIPQYTPQSKYPMQRTNGREGVAKGGPIARRRSPGGVCSSGVFRWRCREAP